jgi:hypothetical protein
MNFGIWVHTPPTSIPSFSMACSSTKGSILCELWWSRTTQIWEPDLQLPVTTSKSGIAWLPSE